MRIPEIYRAGDVQGYLAHYASDLSANYSGILAGSEEARKFMMSLLRVRP